MAEPDPAGRGEQGCPCPHPPPAARQRWRVGVAFSGTKAHRLLTPGLVEEARSLGIDLHVLRPGDDPGAVGSPPLDALWHKVKRGVDPEWQEELHAFSRAHPRVVMVDPIPGVRALGDRATMLQPLDRLRGRGSGDGQWSCRQPPQVVVDGPLAGEELERVCGEAGGMGFPLVWKPRDAAGGAGSHDLAAITGERGLRRVLSVAGGGGGVQPPCVLQPYLPHGPRLHKVYCLGYSDIEVQQRDTLAPPSAARGGVLGGGGGGGGDGDDEVVPLGRPSAEALPGDLPAGGGGAAPALPRALIEEVASAIRGELGVSLFNFDLIACPKEGGGGNPAGYFVVDCNYFPGLHKLHDWEGRVARFLLRRLEGGAERGPSGPAAAAGGGLGG